MTNDQRQALQTIETAKAQFAATSDAYRAVLAVRPFAPAEEVRAATSSWERAHSGLVAVCGSIVAEVELSAYFGGLR